MTEPKRWLPADVLAVATMTLATVDEDGMPHAADVYFAANDEEFPTLYFFSQASARHIKNLADHPKAAVTIHPGVAHWQEIHGIQMRGVVEQVTEPVEREAGTQLYMAKFSFTSALKPLFKVNILYGFRPDWIRMIDNRRGFGFKEERNA